ncbi:LysR family transcriptional regulator [Testudinibacter sp. P27/CKL/0425]
MNIDQINLRTLRFFIGVCHHQSFTTAAKLENVSASMISRSIQQLEDSLGVSLLHRNTRSVLPTEAGLQLLDTAQKMLQEFDWLGQTLHSQAIQGLIRINAPISFGEQHIVPHLAALQARYPLLSIELVQTDAYADPLKDPMDLLFRIGVLNDSSFKARVFATVNMGLFASAAYLERHGTPTTPSDLAQHKSVVYKGHLGVEPWLMWQDDAWQRVQPPVALAVNHGESMLMGAEAGLGIALLADWLSYQAVCDGRLVPVLDNHTWTNHSEPTYVTAIYPNSRQAPPNVRAVIDFFVERFGEAVYWQRF